MVFDSAQATGLRKRVGRNLSIRSYLMVFLVALLARGGWGMYRISRVEPPAALEFPDEQEYWLMAGSYHRGEGLRDEFGFRATRMPLYPAALSLVSGLDHGLVVAKAMQWAVGALAAALAAGLSATMFGCRAGLLAGLYVAFDPFLVFFSSLLLTETLFITLLIGLWWISWPMVTGSTSSGTAGRWLSLGVAASVCIYTRESSIGLVFVLLCFLVACARLQRRAVLGAALAGTVVVASLVPWAMRNQHLTGDWCWLTHRGGISLYDGVGPQADGRSDLGNIQQMPAVAGLNEVEWNRYFLRESIQAIREEPRRIIRLAGVKLSRLWNPLPNVEAYQSKAVRAVSAVWMIPTFLFALAGTAMLPKMLPGNGVRVVLFLLLPALYVSALHSLFVGSVRYRLVAMPMIGILSAGALCLWIQGYRNGKSIEESSSDR